MDENALISAMTAKGHSESTAKATIAGRSGESLQNLYGEYLGTPSASAGGGAGAYGELLTGLPSGLEQAGKLQQPVDKLLANYAMFMRGQPQPIEVFKQFEEETDLPSKRKLAADLRGQIFNLEDVLKRVEPQVAGLTRESLVTEAQRQQLVEEKKEPLRERLGEFVTGLGRIEAGVAASAERVRDMTSLVQAGMDRETQLFSFQMDAMTDRVARLQSAFSEDKQTKLQVLLAKIQRQEVLSDKDRDEAFALLQDEKSFNQSLAKLRETAKLDIESFRKKKEITKEFKAPSGGGVITDPDAYYDTKEDDGFKAD